MKLNLTLTKGKDRLPKTLLLCGLLTYGNILYAEGIETTLAKNHSVTQKELGMWIKQSDYPKMPIQNGASEGYIALDGTPPGFPDHYYLQPLPTDELILNKNLKQNPGWETYE